MNRITLAQREALDVIKDMIDKSNPDVPEFGTKVMTLILGILNVDCIVEHTITQIDGDKIAPIITDNGTTDNDGVQITIPDWIKDKQTPPFSPHPPFSSQVWYNREQPEPIQTNKQEDVRYVTEVSYTGDKNGIVCVTNTADVQYNGDFRDVQTSFNDK